MDRKFLEEKGLEKEAIEKIMAEHGKTIQAVKPAEDYEELKSARETLEKRTKDLEERLTATHEKYAEVDKVLAEKDNQLKSFETTNLKYRIASQIGIPLELAGRIQGDTEEAMKEDAEKLVGFMAKTEKAPLKPTEKTIVDKETQAYASMLENLN